MSDAAAGEDVGVSNLQGLIPLKRARIKIIKIPSIEVGGSRFVDERRLNFELEGFVGAMGMEALAALNKIDRKPDAFFGAPDAVVDAAIKGVRGTLLVTTDSAPQAIQKLESAAVDYTIVDVSKSELVKLILGKCTFQLREVLLAIKVFQRDVRIFFIDEAAHARAARADFF